MTSTRRTMKRATLFFFTFIALLLAALVRSAGVFTVTSIEVTHPFAGVVTDIVIVADLSMLEIPSDAIITVSFSSELTLQDQAVVVSPFDGAIAVNTSTRIVTVERAGDGSTGFFPGDFSVNLTNVSLPARSGTLLPGTISIGNSTHVAAIGEVDLPSVWIAPALLREPSIAFEHSLCGRSTAFSVNFTTVNAVPAGGYLLIQLPRVYSAQHILSAILLTSATGTPTDTMLEVVGTALRLSWNSSATTPIIADTTAVSLNFEGLVHPIIEGPVGRSVRIDTTDDGNTVIDQGYADVSSVLLHRASVVISERLLTVEEATPNQTKSYSMKLSAPPLSAAGISVTTSAHRLSGQVGTPSSLVVWPASVIFSQSNWSVEHLVTVSVLDDHFARDSGDRFFVSHTLVDAENEASFEPEIDNLEVIIEDNDVAMVELSEHQLAVIEGVRNGSYDIVLTSQPATDVIIHLNASLLVETRPTIVTFTPASWNTPQTIHIFPRTAGTTTPRSIASIQHTVSSSGATFSEIVPQSVVKVFFAPLEDVLCGKPLCPKGFRCASADDATLCPTGTFSPLGEVECFACLAGFYCPEPTMDPIACAAWHFSEAGSSVCQLCPAGKDCSSPSSKPIDCPSGYYSVYQASSCLPCPPGAACPVPSSAPVACQPGSFSVGTQTQCTKCAAGFYCPDTMQNTQLPCASGTYSEAGAAVCTSCPAGKQCPHTDQKVVQACPAGSFSVGGQAQCTSCVAGRKCPNVDGSQNSPCPVGTFSADQATQCTSCPAGYACPDPASASPTPCPSGSYSVGGATTCIACPPGYACPDTTSAQRTPCIAGTYSIGGAATCDPCPAGYSCLSSNTSSFSLCTPGWYSLAGSTACVECPRGHYCDVPYEQPKNCSVGSYSLKGYTSCVLCEPGYECPRSDQLPQPCPVGYYSEGGVANCRACRPGYKCGLAAKSPTPPEDACPMGGYCNPTTTFFLCPAGTFGNVTAGESVDHACAPCPEGYFCEMGSTPLTKQNCPSGYLCPIGTKRGSQFPCQAGTYNSLPNQASPDACTPCPAGFYCEEGSSEPVVCPQGYYCLESTVASNQYPCPAGTYSGAQTGLTVSTQCKTCELGTYCPEASSAPVACPAGTYNPDPGAAGLHECLDCPAGWSCPHVGQFEYVDRCAKGHYCPSGTVVATDSPCPAGTYTEHIDLIRVQDCTICPLRHACPQGTGGESQTMLDCGPGFFCPNGTAYAKQFPCPPGTWSSSTALADASECDICPVGKYCSGGKSMIDGDCSPGHYCPLGSPSPTKFPCPSGTFTSKTWLFEPSQCDDCPPGYYCPAGSVSPLPCKPGSYTSLNNTKSVGPGTSWPECITCPAGFYCVDAATVPAPCGKGSFSTKGSKSCSKCEAGFFCNSESTSDTSMRAEVASWLAPGALYGKCYNGTYCPSGTDHEPALEIDACPRGYFCPKATPAPIICPAGTYSNLTGQDDMSDCIPTPSGYFSLEGALQPTGVCSPGFYCPERSTSRTQVPCPARYYLNRTGGQSEEDCAVCVAGSYCPRGSAYPIDCPTGFYCRTGVALPEPCPIGTYSNATGLKQVEGCLSCPPGMYCDSTGLTVPRGLCDPGYYCTLGSYTSAPMSYETTLFGVTNRFVGGLCPRGSYCPLGSSLPAACPPGTYNNFTGLETETQCVQCPPGKYCETPGLVLPTGDCFAGYYCTGGASVPTQVATPVGHFSGNGSVDPTPCSAGQFNTYDKQEQCVVCPAGFFCGSPGTVRPTICPMGSYCPQATALPIKCPTGTFSRLDGLVSIDQCEACPPGQFCDSYGLTAPSGDCFEGFVCFGASPVANPIDAVYGKVCPPGHYCPEGSGAPVQCPNGSFRPTSGGVSLASCTLCLGGSYCGEEALLAPTGLCSEGYYCTLNASIAAPVDKTTGDACPLGFYCPQGTINPIKCSMGTFSGARGQPSCDICPEGSYCDGVTTDRYFDCPAGFYCPPGTGAIAKPCPVGSFSPLTRLVNSSQCQACDPGYYCDTEALTTRAGLCSVGFFCPEGSQDSFGKTPQNATHPCSRGSYCPQGTYVPTPCPVGTYSNESGLGSQQQCTACDAGTYCGTAGLAAPSGPCSAGFFCKRRNSSPSPVIGVSTSDGLQVGGDRCPVGSYCPLGTSEPVLCAEGSYSDQVGAVECTPCPPGFFCPLGSSSYASNTCPQGYYCPVGTKRQFEFPCVPGTFGNRTGLQDVSQCTPAPGGTYIEGYAATKTTGYCKSGFYCSSGSSTSTPASNSTMGGPCLPGTNCPEGSAVPIVCDAGFYCSSTNTDKALPCAPGFYCIQGSYTANPTGQTNALGSIGDVCTAGHYCPTGTSNPIPCPPGNYSENTQNYDPSQCFPCPPGYLCSTSGIVTPYEKCPAGFLCTGGEREATQRCPIGYECPEGSSVPRPCLAGSYSDEEGLPLCKLCPERYYCEAGAITPKTCPPGFFCPIKTSASNKFPCLPGSFSNNSNLASAAECEPCPPGRFCSGAPPTDKPTGDCGPGHYCALGAATSTPSDGVSGDRCAGGHVCISGASLAEPIDGVTGDVCQPGFYCPLGSSVPTRCAKGTYNAVEKQSSCLPCPAGGYCDTNATAPAPCPVRYYCTEATVEPTLCPPGTYGHTTGLESAAQCAPCAAGKFCVAGTLTASCAAGYYCKLFNVEPNPPLNYSAIAISNKTEGFDYGGPCPVGHYCPEGVLDPIPCPNATARLDTHGTSVDDCGPCPAGMSCENGAFTVPCPPGFYCPYAQSAIACPMGTYSPDDGKWKLEDCKLCDAGKLCNRTAVIALTDMYDCPSGHYCLAGTAAPLPCPAGRFRRERGGASVEDCELCTGGSHCGVGTIEPTVCESRVYCPTGIGEPLLCPGGSYCDYNTTTPTLCPGGFYCPPEAASPVQCQRGSYCPTGSVAPLACPLGYIGRVTPLSGVLIHLTDACEVCPPGTYGADPNRTKCEPCLEGYVCLEGTKSSRPKSKEEDNGYPCPPGYFCPPSTSREIACPSGSYQPSMFATNSSSCRLCPDDSYQNLAGQPSCLPCSKSAFAAEGAIKCTCRGSHRAFQMTDGYCICEPGYEFYDQDMVLRSDEDDDVDCQPIVYDRCGSSQVRSDGGGCIAASQVSCENSCGNGTGTLLSSLGICQCDKQTDVDTVCDKKCRESSVQLQVDAATGELQLYDPLTGKTEPLADDTSSSIISKVACAGDGTSCQLHSMALSSSGFAGSYDIPSSIASPPVDQSQRRRRRRLGSSTMIDNPMMCLSVGQGVVFDLTAAGSYPIYMKDSMLNTNPTFDYGAFRSLAAKIRANSSTVTAFAFSFTEAGTYVFGSSLNGATKTVITVMKAGTSCPTEAAIVPLNEMNLIAVSAKRRTDDIILAPDWGLIVGILGGLVGMVASVIAGLYYFRTKSWSASSFRKRAVGYRAASKSTDLSSLHTKGEASITNRSAAPTEGAAQDAAMNPGPTPSLDESTGLPVSPRWTKLPTSPLADGVGGGLNSWDEEDPDLRELVERLQSHHEAVAKSFDDQKGDVRNLLEHLQAEASELKRLIMASLDASAQVESRGDTSTVPLSDAPIVEADLGGASVSATPTTLPVERPGMSASMKPAPLPLQQSPVVQTQPVTQLEPLKLPPQQDTKTQQVVGITPTEATQKTSASSTAQIPPMLTRATTLKEKVTEVQMMQAAARKLSQRDLRVELEHEKQVLEQKFVEEEEAIEREYQEELLRLEEQFAVYGDEESGDASLPPDQWAASADEGDSYAPTAERDDSTDHTPAQIDTPRISTAPLLITKFSNSKIQSRPAMPIMDAIGDAERVLSACRSEYDNEVQALRERMAMEARHQDASLRDRLAKRREQRLREVEAATREDDPETKAQAVAAVEQEVADELARERARLGERLADDERRQLAEAAEHQQRNVRERLAQVEQQARQRQDELRVQQSVAEDDLRRIREEHERELSTLQSSLDAERKRQELKLQEKLAARRAQRLQQAGANGESEGSVESVAAAAEEEAAVEAAERQRLDDELQRRAAQAIDDERRRQQEQEQALALQIALAASQSSAAEAARRAVEAARQAELDRIAAEYQSTRLRADAESASDAHARKLKLGARLAERANRRQRGAAGGGGDVGGERGSSQYDGSGGGGAGAGAGGGAGEFGLDRYRGMGGGRDDGVSTSSSMDPAMTVMDAISDAERVLSACRSEYDNEVQALRERMAMEARRQDASLRDRLAKRREQRLREVEAATREDDPETKAQAVAAVEQEVADELARERARLGERLADDERRQLAEAAEHQQRNVRERLAQVEQQARQRQDELRVQQSVAEDDLRRIREEHERELSTLQSSLDAERKRQELKLQEKLAARRAQRLQQAGANGESEGSVESVAAAAEEEAAVEAAERQRLDDELQRRAAQAIDDERRRQQEQEQALALQIALAASQSSAAEAARRAVEAARQAELDRIAAEYQSTRLRADAESASDAHARKLKLGDRLAERANRRQRGVAGGGGDVGGERGSSQYDGSGGDGGAAGDLSFDGDRDGGIGGFGGRDDGVSMSTSMDPAMTVMDAISDAERVLSACRSEYDNEVQALRERMAMEARRQDASLRDRLAKRREQRLREVEAATREDDPETKAQAVAAVEQEVADELARERARLGERLADDERRQLAEAAEHQQRNVRERLAQVEQQARQRQDELRVQQSVAEDDLRRIREEHERELSTLQSSLDAERKRQELKLQEKLAARRAQRLQQAGANGESEGSVESVAAAAEEEAAVEAAERQRLDDELQRRAAQAIDDERRRQQEQEQALALQIALAASQSSAAEAARRAVEAARQAELDRIAAEYQSTRLRADAESASDAHARKLKLGDRLAERANRRQRGVAGGGGDVGGERGSSQYDGSGGDGGAAGDLSFDGDRDGGIGGFGGRDDGVSMSTSMDPAMTVMDAISDAERVLSACRSEYDNEVQALRERMAMEARRQDASLRDRLAKRREQRLREVEAATREDDPETKAQAVAAVEQEVADELARERARLGERLADDERRQLAEAAEHQQRNVRERLAQVEQQARQRQDELRVQQSVAEDDLRRIREEHERELSTLQSSLDAERKRQELKLQEKLAARRAQRLQQAGANGESEGSVESVAAAAEEEAAVEAAERQRLDDELQRRAAQAIDDERRRQQEQEQALALQIALAASQSSAAEAARRAVEAARQAELDRIAAEYQSTRLRADAESASDAHARKLKLGARLAERANRRQRGAAGGGGDVGGERGSSQYDGSGGGGAGAGAGGGAGEFGLDRYRGMGGGRDDGVSTSSSMDPAMTVMDAISDAERVLSACRSEYDNEVQALRERMAMEARRQDASLRDRLAKRREQRLREVEAATREDDPETKAQAVAAVEQEVADELARERARLGERLADDERRQLAEAAEHQQRNVRERLAQVEQQARQRQDELRVQQSVAEDDLRRIREEHERELSTLQSSLDAERKRQELKLQEKLAARRAQRLQQAGANGESEGSVESVAAAAEEEAAVEAVERQRLDDELQRRAAQAIDDERRRQQEQEQALALQIALAASQSSAAEAARLAAEAARQAELDRIAAEYQSTRLRADAESASDAHARKLKLGGRLADRAGRRQRKAVETVTGVALESSSVDALVDVNGDQMVDAGDDEAEAMRSNAAAVEAQRQAANLQMEAERQAELDRVAKEFGDRSHELRQSQMADFAAQKKKLEARVAAKKQKKLMELQAKKQMERLKLDMQDEAISSMELGGTDGSPHGGDESLPPMEQLSTSEDPQGSVPVILQEPTTLPALPVESEFGESITTSGSRLLRSQSPREDAILRQSIEMRLRAIELLLSQHECGKTDDVWRSQHKHLVLQSIEEACQWGTTVVGDESSLQSDLVSIGSVQEEVLRGLLSEPVVHQLDFANALLRMMASHDGQTTPPSGALVQRIGIINSELLGAETESKSTPAVYDPSIRSLFLRLSSVNRLSGGQLALLLVHAVAEIQTRTSDVTDPRFIRCFYGLLVACYESLYHRSVQEKTTEARQPTHPLPVTPTPSKRHLSSQASTRPVIKQSQSAAWQSRLEEMESFLSAFQNAEDGADLTGMTPRSRAQSKVSLRHQATAVMALNAMGRASSRFLLTSKEGANEMESLMLQERRQFLQEKLDTAEKLYTHILRQMQEQKQAIDYIQEMLAEEQEREAELPREDKAAYVERLEELHVELQEAEAALDKTRRERDELNAQCQALRDELQQLPSSRPSTGSELPSVAASRSDL